MKVRQNKRTIALKNNSERSKLSPTFGTISFTLLTLLRLVATGVADDDFLVGFGATAHASHIHGQVVVCRQKTEKWC